MAKNILHLEPILNFTFSYNIQLKWYISIDCTCSLKLKLLFQTIIASLSRDNSSRGKQMKGIIFQANFRLPTEYRLCNSETECRAAHQTRLQIKLTIWDDQDQVKLTIMLLTTKSSSWRWCTQRNILMLAAHKWISLNIKP